MLTSQLVGARNMDCGLAGHSTPDLLSECVVSLEGLGKLSSTSLTQTAKSSVLFYFFKAVGQGLSQLQHCVTFHRAAYMLLSWVLQSISKSQDGVQD